MTSRRLTAEHAVSLTMKLIFESDFEHEPIIEEPDSDAEQDEWRQGDFDDASSITNALIYILGPSMPLPLKIVAELIK